jgi:hypothetical protein
VRPRGAIPPDPAAVRAALAVARPPRRWLVPALGSLALLAAVASVLVPRAGRATPERPDPRGGAIEARVHPSAFRFLLRLEADGGGRPTELEARLAFRYLVRGEDAEATEDALRRNWEAASRRVAALLARHTRLDFVDHLDRIDGEVTAALDDTLFADCGAEVDALRWEQLKFRRPDS